MPNGQPGDDPVTDIVAHGLSVFSPEIDGLVREVDELGGFESYLAQFWLADQRTLLRVARGELDARYLRKHEDEDIILSGVQGLLTEELGRLRGADS